MGVNPADYAFRVRQWTPGEPIRLLTIARLVEKKGIEYALRAFAIVRREFPNAIYEIIGDGHLASQLHALCRKFDLQNSVVFHGARDADFVREHLNAAHVFLLPSVTAVDGDQEGTPISLMEAQACGLPVISSIHSGIPEVVLDGSTGFLAEERDVEALSQKLLELLRVPDTWSDIGRNGRRHIEAHYNSAILDRVLFEIFEEAIRSHPAATCRPALAQPFTAERPS